MQSYKHLTIVERENLRIKLGEHKSLRLIAREMERNVSSISRELARNKNKDGSYNAWRGTCLYIGRRNKCRIKCRIINDPDLNQWILDCLNQYWPPETIVQMWKIKHPGAKLSHNTIYSMIKAKKLKGINPKTHLRRHGHRKNSHQSATIHPEHLIKDRPEVINERSRIGDWEGDTVYGAIGKGLLTTCVDRKSRLLAASLLKNRSQVLTNEAVVNSLHGLPVQSLNLDNGSEFADFKGLEKSLETTIYFADPHSPWQRGSNENINDLIRFFFPKGTNFHDVTDKALNYVLSLINNRPRKCLGWLSPLEVFNSCCT
jgi:transposase, IS30 family